MRTELRHKSFKERFYLKIFKWAHARYLDSRAPRDELEIGYLGVTDHAIIRYFERVEGYDIEKIKRMLVTIKLGHNTRTFRDGKHVVGKLVAVVKGNTIVTVYPDGASK